jgi:hypothetical protein
VLHTWQIEIVWSCRIASCSVTSYRVLPRYFGNSKLPSPFAQLDIARFPLGETGRSCRAE